MVEKAKGLLNNLEPLPIKSLRHDYRQIDVLGKGGYGVVKLY